MTRAPPVTGGALVVHGSCAAGEHRPPATRYCSDSGGATVAGMPTWAGVAVCSGTP